MIKNISYNYNLEHDTGYAPNPFFGYLTLAACKPCLEKKGSIRNQITIKSLEKGPVWVFANGGANLLIEDYEYQNGNLLKIESNCDSYNRLVYAFRVNEILKFDAYYHDPRFKCKKRIHSTSQIETFGDNNIHSPKNSKGEKRIKYIEDSKVKFVNQKLKKINNPKELNIYVDNVLISAKGEFYYFGCFAPNILEEFRDNFRKGSPGHKPIKDEKVRDKIIDKIEEICSKPGIHGFPSFRSGSQYKNDATNLDYLKEILNNSMNPETKKIVTDWIVEKQETEKFKNSTIKLVI